MKKPTLLLDVDGVLADFFTPAAQIIFDVAGMKLTPDTIPSWDFFELVPKKFHEECWLRMGHPGWCSALQPYEGAQEVIRRLSSKCHIYYVTAPLNAPLWSSERTSWLQYHFEATRDQILIGSAKHLVRGHFFVDDRHSNVSEWVKASKAWGNDVTGFLWAHPYNDSYEEEPNIIRTARWDVIEQAVEEWG